MSEKLGGTLGLGTVLYQGGIDELNRKCRARDDEIDRLTARIADLEKALKDVAEAKMPGLARYIARTTLEASERGGGE